MDKNSHIASLIKLAQADNVLNPIELMFIKGISIRIGVTDEDFNHIIQHLDTVPAVIPVKEEEKLRQLGELVVLMNIDQDNSEDELIFIRDIATKMGFSADKTERIVEKISTSKIDGDFAETLLNL